MSDKKLLELAAKAAGYKVRWHENWKCFVHDQANNITQPPSASGDRHVWVPIDDDGDALRLAVDAGILDGNAFSVWLNCRNGAMAIEGLGAREATRLAFVRVAAEIGKNMAD
ncbi:TPA: hypothetical protein ACIR1N_003897 [Pseudomonas aeruginosa]|uniref:hypothetical protein n=1 Tax=Pseudomonas aeruginosa TaxID=287 RepID=UPI001CA5531D|nr:hypothetical protein [Pseudomonas aeruginosa]MBW6313942.1 hypothetical protein [Pseudomonas aeruginosa]MDE5044794.1 hypothetical protein [Pseudomonas aeruginosa]HBO1050018.1 hypothetical protein [Pseudomonas aeruginosa]HEJ2485240.1 hypothetical protein [Pseudomonas aeruginosa]